MFPKVPRGGVGLLLVGDSVLHRGLSGCACLSTEGFLFVCCEMRFLLLMLSGFLC